MTGKKKPTKTKAAAKRQSVVAAVANKEGRDEKGLFLKGNKIWENTGFPGRPRTFNSPEELWGECLRYFKWVEENPLLEEKLFHTSGVITKDTATKVRPMTQAGLCVFIGITRETWTQWRRNPDFADICLKVDEIMYEQKFSGACADLMNHAIIARDLGLADKKEFSGPNGGPIQGIEIVMVTGDLTNDSSDSESK